MLNVELVEQLGPEPVTLAEAKEYCKIDSDYTAEDDLLSDLILSARRSLEMFGNISLVEKRLKVFTDSDKTLWLPYSPVIEVESIIDPYGNTIEYDPTFKYKINIKNIVPYSVIYTAGFRPLPKDIKLAVLKQVLTDYDNRGNFTVSDNSTVRSATTLANSAKNLVRPYSRNLLL